MQAYLLTTAIIFTLTTLRLIANGHDAAGRVMCLIFAALSAWGFYLWFNFGL